MTGRSAWRAAGRLARGAALAALLQAPAHAQPPAGDVAGDEITVDAESLGYDQREDILSASGAVVIRRGDMTLSADAVQLNRRTNEARAVGDAVLSSPQGRIAAREMSLDLENETGELRDADIYSDTLGYSLSGKRIQKGRGQSYRIEDGRFTTCNCAEGPQPWTIAGETLDVALDGYGTLRGGKFEVLDVPILYLPRAAFPVSRQRQSGLLFPRVGFSNRRGFQLLQPLYWAIDKSQDATVSVDVETAARLGLVGEYRYALDRNSGGVMQAGYFNEAIRGRNPEVTAPPGVDTTVPENRWGLFGDLDQRIGSARAYANLLLVGDNQFLREMNAFTVTQGQETALRTRPFTTSRAGVRQEWSRGFVLGEGVFYQDLVGPVVLLPNGDLTERESLVIQRAPEVDVAAQKQFGFNLLGEVTGSVTNFQRTLGIAGGRIDLLPAVTLRLPLGRAFTGTFNAAYRQTAYGLTENQMSGGFLGDDPAKGEVVLPSTSSRQLFALRADLGTELARIFAFPHFGLDKIKHTIEPRLSYFYVPSVNQDDLPVFDGIDRINRRSLITYELATRLIARGAPSDDGARGDLFELTRFSIAQSYDTERRIPPTSALDPISGLPTNPDPGDHFSDIDFSLRINPSQVVTVRMFSTFDAGEGDLSSATVGIRLREPLREMAPNARPRLLTRASFTADYRFITDDIVQLLDASMVVPVTDRFGVLYATRYDIVTNTFLENYVGIRLISACDCWALNVGLIDTSNPNELQVQAQLTLAGLGQTGVGGGGRFGSSRFYSY